MWRAPSPVDWAYTALFTFLFTIAASAVGIASALFEFQITTNFSAIMKTAAIAFIAPALFEELIFRGPLLRMRSRLSKPMLIVAAAASLTLFVLWHPLNAAYFLTAAKPLFFDPVFLLIAAMLGATATIITLLTQSLWCSIAFHWSVVVGWKWFMSGPNFF